MPRNAEELAFWWGLVVPLGLLVLSFKVWRVFERGELNPWWAAPDLIRSDILAVLTFAAFGWAALRSTSSRTIRVVVLGTAQLIALLWGVLEVIANHFFAVTGSTFDLHLLIFSVGRLDETFSVIASEVSTASWVLLGVVVAVLAMLCWALRAWARKQESWTTNDEHPVRFGMRTGLIAGFGCALFAVVPPVAEDYSAFGRANVVNMALSVQDVRVTGDIEAEIVRQSLDDLQVAPIGDDDKERPTNVAIIILESTRAQSMTVYNESIETTPFLDGLAEYSTVADRAYVTVPHTSKALVGILCGLEPRLRMPITEALPGGLPARCLPDLLADVGYESVFLQSATERFEDRPGLVDNMGYDDFIPLERLNSAGYEEANYFGYEDAIMLPYSRAWHEARGDDPFLTTYLTLTPHHDYLAPRRYGRFDFAADDEFNRYKNTLYYVDQFSRELIEQYEELGLFDDTLFVFVGDHGEAFEEHGRSQHDNVIWEPGVHIPLLIFDPTDPEGRRIVDPVSQIDVVPTILEWLGFELEHGEFPGMPIWDSHPERTVYAHCWYERRCMAKIGKRYKYIDHFGQRGAEVYDLLEDPGEQNNLVAQKQDEIRDFRNELYGWRESVNALYRREQTDQVDDHIYEELPDGVIENTFELGDFARHLGYQINTDELRRGRRITITHYYEALQPIPTGWELFIHGVSESDWLNLDRVPVDGMHPLDEWEEGTIIADEHSFRIPRDWSPGDFTLYLGIFHRDEGRVPILGDVETDGEDRAVVFEKPFR